ncbi:MAG: hypothetical protein WCT52_05115 [Candidatus Micrarchaeia archaeon]
MFVFQAYNKPQRYGVEMVAKREDNRLHPSIEGGTEASTSGLRFYVIPGLNYKKTGAGVRLDFSKGEKPGVSPWISTYNKYGSASFGLSQNAFSVSGGRLGVTLNSGIGLYYDYFGKLADGKLELISQGGGAGDSYGMYNFVKALKTGAGEFNTYLAGAKAIVDGGYSIFKRGIEAIWPDIKLGGDRPPTKEALQHVRDGTASQDGSDGQKPVVDRGNGVKYCVSVLQYEHGEHEDRRKAAIMLTKLFATDLLAISTGGNKFNLADWERVMEAVDKNKGFFASETVGAMRQMQDEARLSSSGMKTFGFLENAMKSGGVGGGVASLFAGLFSADELSVGVPLGAGRIIRPWEFFEDIGSFKNTNENKGFFGKVIGFFEDVVHDVLSVPAKIVEAISPVYRRSDAWAQDARNNVEGAITENERLLSKLTSWGKIEKEDLKALNTNLTYLGSMLAAVSGSDEKLAGRLREHLGKNELTYTIFTSKVARMEMDDAVAELEGGKYKGTPIEGQLAEFINQSAIRLSDSFVYLRLFDQKGISKELAAELRYERLAIKKEIETIAGQYPGYQPLLAMQENAYKIAKSFREGGFNADWEAVARLIKNNGTPDGKSQQEAFGKFSEAVSYAGTYSTVRQEFEAWSLDGKNKEGIRNAMEDLAGNIATKIENADGKTDPAALQEDIGMLSTMGSIFRRSAGEFEGNEKIVSAMERLAKNLDVDYDELENDAQKQKFVSSLDVYTIAFYGLKGINNGMVEAGSLEDWQAIVPDAAKTLYGITKESEKGKGDASGTWRTWHNLNAVFGKDAVTSELSKKEKDYITSQV